MEEEIFNNFSFLAVDDNDYYAQSIKQSLQESLGVDVRCIIHGRYAQMTMLEVEKIYSEGKYPVIVLDDQLGEHEINGTQIMKDLVENYEQGGVLFASDTLYRAFQLWKWKSILEHKKESKWLIGNYNGTLEIEERCKEFVNNLHNKEQGIELKNR